MYFSVITKKEIERMFTTHIKKLRKFDASAITIVDIKGKIKYADDRYTEISGYTPHELIDNTFNIIRDIKTPKYFYKQMWDLLKQNKEWEGIVKNKHKNGDGFLIKLRIIPFTNTNGETFMFGESRPIYNQTHELEKLYYQQFDKLTGIHNREIMINDICQRSEKFFQIALFDIDNFKGINEFYGYQIGDELVKKVANIITNHMDITNYRLYHISIDEFALIDFTNNVDTDKLYFKAFCKDILNNIEHRSIKLNNKIESSISISCGLSVGTNAWQGLKEADMALHHAKSSLQQLVDFTKSTNLHKKLELKMYWLNELKSAIIHDNIIPWLQPIYDNRTGKIVRFEALMRLIDSNNNIITPYNFLDFAKPTKLYEKISSIMIMETMNHFAKNHDHFNINISWEDIKVKSTINNIKNLLDQYEDLGPRMTIELVESESIENYERFEKFITSMKDYGVKIALDDFGSGYSNFVYLDKIKVDTIKIDGSLIDDMMSNENTLFIVKSIISIAKQLKIETVAEFVSDEKTFNKVKELGIDYSQGYYIGKPRPIDW